MGSDLQAVRVAADLCRVAAMNFGIRFDLRNPHSPESLAEAVKYVQLWAKREGIEIPEGLEPVVHREETDPNDWRTYSTMYLGFDWAE